MDDLIIHKRKLPHFYQPGRTYFITFIQKDSHPHTQIKVTDNRDEFQLKYDKDISTHQKKNTFVEYDEYIDLQISGNSKLIRKDLAAVVANTIHYLDNKDYELICYCIMPNHVHLVFSLIEKSRGISKIMQSIKRYSASEINKILKQKGSFWQDESYDRIVRNEVELFNIVQYVINNPVKALLVDNWEKWEYTYIDKSLQNIII
jgi:Transposase and inactivated derivatives